MFAKITNKTDKKISFARALRSANDSNMFSLSETPLRTKNMQNDNTKNLSVLCVKIILGKNKNQINKI